MPLWDRAGPARAFDCRGHASPPLHRRSHSGHNSSQSEGQLSPHTRCRSTAVAALLLSRRPASLVAPKAIFASPPMRRWPPLPSPPPPPPRPRRSAAALPALPCPHTGCFPCPAPFSKPADAQASTWRQEGGWRASRGGWRRWRRAWASATRRRPRSSRCCSKSTRPRRSTRRSAPSVGGRAPATSLLRLPLCNMPCPLRLITPPPPPPLLQALRCAWASACC